MVSPVFISYTRDTKPIAKELTEFLSEQGIKSWADFNNISLGSTFQDSVGNAIDDAGSFVVLIGPDSSANAWREYELQAVLSKVWRDPGKKLLPVLVGDAQVPAFLRDRNAIHVDPEAEPRDWTRQVVSAIKSPKSRPTKERSVMNTRDRRRRLDELEKAAVMLGDDLL
jgi:hypothetical protein